MPCKVDSYPPGVFQVEYDFLDFLDNFNNFDFFD